MATIYEVYVEGNEPWTSGQRNAVMSAVRQYMSTDCNVQLEQQNIDVNEYDDAEELLNIDPDFIGIGANVHEDADGFCFKSKTAADNFTSIIQGSIDNLGMTVAVYKH